ncbi:ADP-ribosylation factor-related protein 1 [Hordeum vulgare]|nr:ADP-ribosylation factor-related protein 1 [Hordeum vulgare]
MGLWNYGRKGKHNREASSSSGRRRDSVKEEAALPPRRASAPAPFTIGPRPAGQRDRQYLSAEVCRRYWETRTSVPWSDVHLPNNWHLSADRVSIPPVPTRSSAAAASSLTTSTTTTGTPLIPCCGTRDSGTSTTCGVPRTSTAWCRGRGGTSGGAQAYTGAWALPSPSSSPPPPPRLTAQEEAQLMQRVMEDSMITHDERQWSGLEDAMALSAADDVVIPELMEAEEVVEDAPVVAFHPDLVGQQWRWSGTAPEMAHAVGA